MSSTAQSLREVFSHLSYVILALAAAAVLLLFIIWLPNLALLRYLLTSSAFSAADILRILWGSLWRLADNFTLATRLLAIISAALFGINLAMLIYFFRRQGAVRGAGGTGLLGAMAGVFGVGCSSCGSVLLSIIFGAGATSVLLSALPFKGAEIGFVGIFFQLFSVYLISSKLQQPMVCYPINIENRLRL